MLLSILSPSIFSQVMLKSQQESRHEQFWLDPFRFCKTADTVVVLLYRSIGLALKDVAADHLGMNLQDAIRNTLQSPSVKPLLRFCSNLAKAGRSIA